MGETQPAAEAFVGQLTNSQTQLYGYVYSLLGDHSRAADVLQETNLVLWRKLEEFQPDRPFLPWAFAIARFQVLAHLRDHRRDRLLLDSELAEAMSPHVEQHLASLPDDAAAVQLCLQKLSADHRQLIEKRYFRSMPVRRLAEELDRSVSSVKVALLRIRRQLGECLQRRAVEGQHD
ncbi:MAG: sigma-70 family RNA polymerase sigma factor [Planctomycetaceae bacterium]|nr:sigma-70 family RNA polymerase sigma factor [Planctomycetaceae bacterium]